MIGRVVDARAMLPTLARHPGLGRDAPGAQAELAIREADVELGRIDLEELAIPHSPMGRLSV